MINKRTDILLFNRSFWPDIEATGQFLTELCEQLAKRYKVTVITGRSYYLNKDGFKIGKFYRRETFNGVNILRVYHTKFWKKNLIGRIINWLTYSMLAFMAALKMKPKIIIVCTDPPFLGIIGMVISRLKSAPFIYNCRDLFPDVAIELGKLKKQDVLANIFDHLNRKAFNSAKMLICLGQSMESRVRKKRVNNIHIKVVTDWVDTTKVKPIPKTENPLREKLGLKDNFVIMHSGNIGLSQDFSSILKAVNSIKYQSSFYLVFVGEGAGKELLEKEINCFSLKNILFLPYQPLDMLSFSLSMADLHVVSLKKGMAGAVVPSKVYGIMAAGRPYLAITDRESEPAQMALEFKCGLWAEAENPKEIAESINWAMDHPVELGEMGETGRRIAETKFDKNIVINEWFKLLENLKV